MDRAPFVLTQQQIAARQRLVCERNISKAGGELEIFARELQRHPADVDPELCDELHKLLGRIEANAALLNAAPSDDAQLNAHAKADEADARRARSEP